MNLDPKIIDYIEAAILWRMRSGLNDLNGSFEPSAVQISLLASYIHKPVDFFGVPEVFNRLVATKIFQKIADDLAGSFYALDRQVLLNYVDNLQQDPTSLYSKMSVVGLPFLEAALKSASTVDDNLSPIEYKSADIPASDRTVSLNHNQTTVLDEKTSELIEAVERENAVPDNPGLREKIIGHLRAGRELIRVGVFDAQLFYLSLVVGIKMLIEKYQDHAIGAIASKLLDLILQEVGIG